MEELDIKEVLKEMFDGFIDVIINGLEEEKERLLYIEAVIEFMNKVGKEKRLSDIFVDKFLNELDIKLINYLAR
jgi:hypothetical protein